MQPKIDLSGLKDLHLLAQPDIWPLAYGWWIIIGGVCALFILAMIGFVLWRRRPVVYAIRKINKLGQKNVEDLVYIKKISQLLRRVAIAADGRPAVAQLSDTKWQQFLLDRAPDTLTEQEAHLIAFAPYEPTPTLNLNRSVLTNHLVLWVKKVLKNKKSS